MEKYVFRFSTTAGGDELWQQSFVVTDATLISRQAYVRLKPRPVVLTVDFFPSSMLLLLSLPIIGRHPAHESRGVKPRWWGKILFWKLAYVLNMLIHTYFAKEHNARLYCLFSLLLFPNLVFPSVFLSVRAYFKSTISHLGTRLATLPRVVARRWR